MTRVCAKGCGGGGWGAYHERLDFVRRDAIVAALCERVDLRRSTPYHSNYSPIKVEGLAARIGPGGTHHGAGLVELGEEDDEAVGELEDAEVSLHPADQLAGLPRPNRRAGHRGCGVHAAAVDVGAVFRRHAPALFLRALSPGPLCLCDGPGRSKHHGHRGRFRSPQQPPLGATEFCKECFGQPWAAGGCAPACIF